MAVHEVLPGCLHRRLGWIASNSPVRKTNVIQMSLSPSVIALGIDVGGARKGFHAVALNAARQVIGQPSRLASAAEIASLMITLNPSVVAIDAPCQWSQHKSREAERALARAGIRCFFTPSRARARRNLTFYGWMFQGEAAFAAASLTHPHYTGSTSVWGQTIEVFPHATTLALTRQATPKRVSKNQWRRQLLRSEGIDPSPLTNIDYIDAALCALTGLHALNGNFTPHGDPSGGYLVTPVTP